MFRLVVASAFLPGVVVAAMGAADEIGGLAGDFFRPASVGAAMFIAYRVTTSAHRESASVYRAAAADADARADAAEARLAAYMAAADTKIGQLVAENERLRRAIGPADG